MERTFYHKNEWAIILGGSTGLGLATAMKLASKGMHICIIHRSRRSEMSLLNEKIDQMKTHQVSVVEYNIDATRADKRLETIHEISEVIFPKGRVKTLVHSISRGNLKPMNGETTLENNDFHMTIDAMAISLYDWVKAISKKELFATDARVLSFTSEGNKKAWKNYAAVSAAKAALEAISRNIALEFALAGIKSNCIQAGVTETASFKMIPGNEVIKNHTLRRNPYQRLTIPENVADVVYLLCRDEAAWINGAVIPVDGGERNC